MTDADFDDGDVRATYCSRSLPGIQGSRYSPKLTPLT